MIGALFIPLQMKFNQTARNQPAPSTAAPVAAAVPGPVAAATNNAATGAPAGPAPTDNFVQVLAQSDPQQQKQIIGEQLYRQIYSLHNELAGKITGTVHTSHIIMHMHTRVSWMLISDLQSCVCLL